MIKCLKEKNKRRLLLIFFWKYICKDILLSIRMKPLYFRTMIRYILGLVRKKKLAFISENQICITSKPYLLLFQILETYFIWSQIQVLMGVVINTFYKKSSNIYFLQGDMEVSYCLILFFYRILIKYFFWLTRQLVTHLLD